MADHVQSGAAERSLRTIRNPFLGAEGYHCFACSPDNGVGMHMTFSTDGEKVVSVWNPDERYEGYTNVVHGGIQTVLMDETAAWFVSARIGTSGVTKSMNVEYLKPVLVSNGPLTIRACLESRDGNIAKVDTTVSDKTGEVCTKAVLEFFLYPEHIARKRFRFPGKEAFDPE